MRSALTTAFFGLVAGFVGGLLGVGGGIILVPVLVLGFHLTQRQASATSLAVIVAAATAAALRFAVGEEIDYGAAAALLAGSAVGAVVGARSLARIPDVWVARAFVAVALVAAVRLAVSA